MLVMASSMLSTSAPIRMPITRMIIGSNKLVKRLMADLVSSSKTSAMRRNI